MQASMRFAISFDFLFYDVQGHDMMHNIYKEDTTLILARWPRWR